MNILVTGANGQLGNEMRLLAALGPGPGPDARFIFTDINQASEEAVAMLRRLAGGAAVDTTTRTLDITDPDAVHAIVAEEGVDVIVNCAAFTNVDAAETQAELAEMLNARAPEILACEMRRSGGLLVHISTDYVFGGELFNSPCGEELPPSPTGVYGLTKLHGEQAVLGSGCQSVILRTAWLYSEFGKNFMRTMLNLTASRPQLKVVFDQCGTPTYAGDLAAAIFEILSDFRGRTGIYHFSNEGVCSWFDFAKSIAREADAIRPEGRRLDCEILPCHSDEFPSPVRRPAYSVLDKTKIKQAYPTLRVPYWTDSLRKCLKNIL